MSVPGCCGNVVELFSGIQGEGVHVGRRHLFLRLAACNLVCEYCDQPEARTIPRSALIEQTPGHRDFLRIRNPVDATTLAHAIQVLKRQGPQHHALAVTGGEPLVQNAFLAKLLPKVRGVKILLETNGTLPQALGPLLPRIDIVSMDIKLKSATGRPMPRQCHEKFLRLATRRRAVEVFVKAVVTADTTPREITAAARMVANVRKSIPFILQPVTELSGRQGPPPPKPSAVLALQDAAARVLHDVRVIPQTHKIMDQR